MTREQEIYLGMFLTFANTATVHEAGLAKWPEILAARDLINTKKGAIDALKLIQDNGAISETGFKGALRNKLNLSFGVLVKAIKGNIAGDAKMEAAYKKVQPSDLGDERDTEVETTLIGVVKDAEGMIAKLERADITTAMLAEMKVLAAAYTKAIAEKGTAKDASVQATADMAKEFDFINDELRKLDAVINGMPDSKSTERAALQKAREIKNA